MNNQEILHNLTSALESNAANTRKPTVVDKEMWLRNKRDFQRSILSQIREDNFGNNKTNRAVSYIYRLKEPLKRLFNKELFKRMVSETFGWAEHWNYDNTAKTIYIDPVRCIQAFKILHKEYTDAEFNNEINKHYEILCKKSNLEELVSLSIGDLDDVSEVDESEQTTEEIERKLSLKAYIDNFFKECVHHTDDIGEEYTMKAEVAFLMFYYYVNRESEGEHCDAKASTIIKLINRKLRMYEETHINKQNPNKKLVKIIRRSDCNYYRNIQIKIADRPWYPKKKRNRTSTTNTVQSYSMSKKLKQKR